MCLATCNLKDWDVVAAEPRHGVHLLPLAESLPESELTLLVITPGEDLRELSLRPRIPLASLVSWGHCNCVIAHKS